MKSISMSDIDFFFFQPPHIDSLLVVDEAKPCVGRVEGTLKIRHDYVSNGGTVSDAKKEIRELINDRLFGEAKKQAKIMADIARANLYTPSQIEKFETAYQRLMEVIG